MSIPRRLLQEKLLSLLAEDIGQGDVTTVAIVRPKAKAEAEVIAKATGVAAGIEEASALAEALGLQADSTVEDGAKLKKGQVLLKLSGEAATILVAERTLLNLVSRMSGIATATFNLTDKIRRAKLKVHIAATRKSAPGLLYFDKKAVTVGGGDPHRLHLDDMVLIKDNHIAVAGSLEKAVKLAKRNTSFSKKIEVEVTSATEALEAAKLGADVVMLDNFSPAQIKEAFALLEKRGFVGKVLLEASGGVTSENLLEYADSGVDLISLGELTHSVKGLDVSLEIVNAS